MYSFHSDYTTALASPFKENWVVRLYDKDGSYIGISFSNVTMGDSISYVGAIMNAPSIREAINFETGRASNGNINLEVSDHTVGSNKFSKEIYSGNYLNQDVKVYSTLGSITDFAKIPLIFSGRLDSVSTTETERIKLSVVSKRPWDNIALPNEVSDTGVYVPVVYGEYTGHTTADFMTSKALYPSPKTSSSNGNFYFLASKSESSPVINFYDSRAEIYANLDLYTEATVTKDGRDAFEVDGALLTTYKFRPKAVVSGSGFTNPAYAIDGNSSNYATQSHTVTSGGSQTTDLKLELPSISGKFTSATLYLSGSITISSFVDSGTITLSDYSFGSLSTITQRDTGSGVGTTALASSVNILSSIVANSNKLPDSIVLRLASSSLDDIETSASINGIYLYLAHTVDSTNEPTASGEIESKLEKVYCGNDGFDKSWSSGTAQKAHEVHRDILQRFLGITSPSGYTSVDNEKTGNVRFYTNIGEPQPMKSLLDKLAYEGGFVFRFKADGTPVYHHIPNSPSVPSGLTLSHNDIKGLDLKHTGLSDMITSWVVRYSKNPAGSQFESNATHTSSNRTNFFASGSKEAIKEVKLNYLIDNVSYSGGDNNDTFLDYYDSVLGDVKQLISFQVVNPSKSYVEVGDIIDFNNSSMKIDSLSGAWTSLKFIVTSTNRSVGGTIDVSAREI